MIEIDGIEPNAGPLYGETRVLVRIKNYLEKMTSLYPQPKCKFGSKKMIVDATWVKCLDHPRKVGEKEVRLSERNFTCIQCEFSPPSPKEDIVPLTVSLLGDFTDIKNSVPFRYYKEPIIHWIYPRYGSKDGGTFVEIFGENFLNFDQNLRCGFGTSEVKAYYVSHKYIICYSPQSSVVEKRMPFSISLNNQQNTKQDISYIYFDWAQVASLSPNKGPDTGGTVVRIKGQNFDPTKMTSFHNYNDTFCRFGNLSLAVATVVSTTEMICVSPPSYELREVPVEVTLNNREWTNDGILFYYYHPPFVYAIDPRIGPVAGGTVVTITGSNFIDTGIVLCRFGSIITKGQYINENTLKCTAPKVEKPGYVNLAVAIREDEFSSGINTRYLYYDTPEIDRIEPLCGPERGYTQISVIGKNFADTGSDYMKCVFDGRIFMNATRMSDNEIKCDSPSVLNYAGVNENNITFYYLAITLNGYDTNGPFQKFMYYKETFISSLNPIYGPISGNTTVKISGGDFAQPGACNVTVRFSTYMVRPLNYSNSSIFVSSPESNYTGAVVVQVALNGKQFDKDIKINFRDKENTFYYYNLPLITLMKPIKGPTIGGTKVMIFGMGFENVFNFEPDVEKHIIYYRFIDLLAPRNEQPSLIGGQVFKTVIYSNNYINIFSPPTYKNNSLAAIELSYNAENFFRVETSNFTYFTMANITALNPKYGPLKSKDFQEISVMFDNYYCIDNCDNIICRFTSKNNIFVEKGRYMGPNKVNCTVPRVNIPDIFRVEVSFNGGEEFTNNKKNFTFYDPYVIKVGPKMISSSGGTILEIHGYGFADSGDNLKVKFGASDKTLKCDLGSCIVKGKFVNENLITAITYNKDLVSYLSSGRNIEYDRFAVEVSIYNDDFTNNNITVFYFDEPYVIKDVLTSTKLNLTAKEKEFLLASLVNSIPANMDTFVIIPVDSSRIYSNLKNIELYANYSCKFESVNNKSIFKITSGLLTSFPMNTDKRNIFLCQSPRWEEVGEFKVMISLNRYDFSETYWTINLTDPINILKIEPPCGPTHGMTKMKLMGTGFEKSNDFVFKFGVQNVIPMTKSNLWEEIKENEISPVFHSKFKIHKLEIEVPTAPKYLTTYGGLDYISVAKISTFPLINILSKYNMNTYVHTNIEYYYYKQQYIQSFSPHGSIITGGTTVLVVGAWFGFKPEYGYRPYCRFGDKIVDGVWLSTVRISCVSPPYPKANIRVPFDVSFNKYDFSSSGLQFTYFSDFTKAKFDSYEPTSGPDVGGTIIKLYGKNFTSLLNPEEFLCMFKPRDGKMEPKKVPAGYKEYADGRTAIICTTPGGWASGTVSSILITFDGQRFIDSYFDFYFYKVELVEPMSGPSIGNGPIQVIGAGFQNTTKVKCILDKVVRNPVYITEKKIGCLMAPAPTPNFTGKVEFQMTINGIDRKDFPQGFYYYIQPNISSIYPNSGPNSGNALVKVFGSGFRKDFAGVNLGCKIGDYYGRGEFVSETELYCFFNSLPLIDRNQTLNFSIALNNYSFTEELPELNFVPYGIVSIEPSSGPISGGTDILVKGAGFFESNNIRCRFGVDGYYQYTFAKYIDYNHVVCSSPENFVLPVAGQLPFSVPFSIAMNDDLYNPWTESTHFFSFYENPNINTVYPVQGKTNETTEITVTSTIDKPFATPSAIIIEESIIDYSKGKSMIMKKSFSYQPIKCRFGRFGTSSAIYVNRTMIKCITPRIEDDSDISFEDVTVGIALNGVDFIENSNAIFTFQGPNAGRMLWVYILITLFIALIIGLLVYLASSYWDRIQSTLADTHRRDVYSSDMPHVIQKQPRYLNPDFRPDVQQNQQNQIQ